MDAGIFTSGLVQSIRAYPGDHARWLANITRKGVEVAGFVVKSAVKR
jgi:hypothetical protein